MYTVLVSRYIGAVEGGVNLWLIPITCIYSDKSALPVSVACSHSEHLEHPQASAASSLEASSAAVLMVSAITLMRFMEATAWTACTADLNICR